MSARHYDRQVAECKGIVQKDACPTHVIRVDLDWLNERLRELALVADRISSMRSEYRHGVVYAARFTRDDVPFLIDNRGSGVVCAKRPPISKEDYVARERACTIHAFAGPDHAIDISMNWGTPAVKNMVSSGKISFNGEDLKHRPPGPEL